MGLLLAFILVCLVVFALLGRASQQPWQRRKVRHWDVQEWQGNIKRGFGLISDAGARRSGILGQMTDRDLEARERQRQERERKRQLRNQDSDSDGPPEENPPDFR